MRANWLPNRGWLIVGLLGGAILHSSPANAERGNGRTAAHGARGAQGWHRGNLPPGGHGYGHGSYRRPGHPHRGRWVSQRAYPRRVWVGPVPRHYCDSYGYGWGYHSSPSYWHRGHNIHVRPIHFTVSAGVVIGGVGVSATYANPGYLYGCNFCDERFTTYGAYATHVGACSYTPHGYHVEPHDWDHDSSDQEWRHEGDE